jgi:hypothetical protein
VVDLTVNGTSGTVSFVWSTQNGSGIVQGAEDQSTLSDGDYTVMVYEDGVRLLSFDFSILVSDNQAPVLNAPAAIQRKCGQSIPAAYSTWSEFANAGGTVRDNCQIYYSSFRLSSEVKSNPDCPYTLTRVYEITDVNGNRGVAEHLIIVEAEELVLKSGMGTAGLIVSTATGGDWNATTTWVGGVVPSAGDDVEIVSGATVNINNNVSCDNILINGTLNLSASDTLQVNSNWTNNGLFLSGTDGAVEFAGSSSGIISGSTTTNFKDFILNKGGIGDVLQVNSNIDLGGTILFLSGLLQINGSTVVNCSHNEGFTIEDIAGLYINGGTFISGPFSISNKGLIQMDNGTATVGRNLGNSLTINNSGTLDINGGTLNIAGRLEVSGGNVDISGGIINLNTEGHNSSTATLDLSLASDFTMTAGVINFLNPNGSGGFDVNILNGVGGNKSFAGGNLNFGDATSNTYKIASEVDFPAITSTSTTELVLRRIVSSIGSYSFPLITNDGNAIPATLTLTSSTGSVATNSYIEIKTSKQCQFNALSKSTMGNFF